MYTIAGIPAFVDNYMWALHDNAGHCYVVDPGDAEPVEAWLRAHAQELRGILITHHHPDHTGGIAQLLRHRQIPVYGPDNPTIRGISTALRDGDELLLPGLELRFRVLAVPGHTLDHIAFFNAEQGILFCGDTLFSCGCGRLFEGSPEQMHASLQKLAALPGTTRVYCTHEYTLANMRFATAVEPHNTALIEAQQDAERRRANAQPTLPSDIATQRAINPFLRCEAPEVIRNVQARNPDAKTPTDIFAALRSWKDRF